MGFNSAFKGLMYMWEVSSDMIWYDMIYWLTAIGLTPVGNGTVHIYTRNNTQRNTMRQKTHNIFYDKNI